MCGLVVLVWMRTKLWAFLEGTFVFLAHKSTQTGSVTNLPIHLRHRLLHVIEILYLCTAKPAADSILTVSRVLLGFGILSRIESPQ